MARTSQIGGFVTRAPAARPITLSGRADNGGGPRATRISAGREPTIQGSKRATRTKGGKS